MLDAFTSKEQICFNAKVLDEHLPIAFDVIADLVLRPKFDSEDVKKERKVVLEEIKMDLDNPEYLLHEIFTRGFWPGHSLGRPRLPTMAARPTRKRPSCSKKSAISSKRIFASGFRRFRLITRTASVSLSSIICWGAACLRGCSRTFAKSAAWPTRFSASSHL